MSSFWENIFIKIIVKVFKKILGGEKDESKDYGEKGNQKTREGQDTGKI